MSAIVSTNTNYVGETRGKLIVELSNGVLVTVLINASTSYWNIYTSTDGGTTWTQGPQGGSGTGYIAMCTDGTFVYIFQIVGHNIGSWYYQYATNALTNGVQVTGYNTSVTVSHLDCDITPNGTVYLAVQLSVSTTYEANLYYTLSPASTTPNWTQSVGAISSNLGWNPYDCAIYAFSDNTATMIVTDGAGSFYAWHVNQTTSLSSDIKVASTGSNQMVYFCGRAVDYADRIHLAFWSNGSSAISYFRVDDKGAAATVSISNVNVTGLSSYSGLANGGGSMYIDTNNNPHLFVGGSGNTGVYTKLVNGTWTPVTTYAAGLFSAVYQARDENTNNIIHLMYRNNSDGYEYVTNVTLNTAPNAPTYSWISSNGSTINGRPKLFFNVSDPDSGNTIQNVEVQVANNSSFTSPTWDVQYGADSGYGTQVSGWSGLPTGSNTSTQISYLPSSAMAALTAGTWYVRARCKDNNGAWGAWSATQSFTVSAAPWNDTPNGYGMKAQWMNDLTTVLNNGESFRGWNPFAMFNLDTTWDIQPWHVGIRRALLQAHQNLITNIAPNWTTNSGLTPLTTIDQNTGGWMSGTANDFSFYGSQGSSSYTGGLQSTQHLLGGVCPYVKSSYAGSQYISIYTFGTPTAVTAGQTYSQEVWFMAPAGRSVALQGSYQTTKGTRATTGTTGRTAVTVTATGNWQRVTATFTVPTGITYAETEVGINNAQNGDTLYVQMIPMYTGNVFTLDRTGQDVIDLRNACASVV